MELIEIQENSLLKSKFEAVELCDFYKNYLDEDHFLQLRKFARRQLQAAGCLSEGESVASLGLGPAVVLGGPSAVLGDRGSCSADSGVRAESPTWDFEAGALASIHAGIDVERGRSEIHFALQDSGCGIEREAGIA
ncbi:hypothetical protein EVAR_84508_1 [Eumeta japonica]|uniref:Uncharacterized protein n=1 Tax=Eumeta variegata TaxID=151549 RepID=A0A4C1UIG6_EUMVA|nr:hypothetical protein EVAR_84508_1 [Eumeta japonica]